LAETVWKEGSSVNEIRGEGVNKTGDRNSRIPVHKRQSKMKIGGMNNFKIKNDQKGRNAKRPCHHTGSTQVR
jgi:hypothetical protein